MPKLLAIALAAVLGLGALAGAMIWLQTRPAPEEPARAAPALRPPAPGAQPSFAFPPPTRSPPPARLPPGPSAEPLPAAPGDAAGAGDPDADDDDEVRRDRLGNPIDRRAARRTSGLAPGGPPGPRGGSQGTAASDPE